MITLLKSRMNLFGGAEKYTWQLAHAFAEKNMPVSLLTSGPPIDRPRHPLIQITTFPANSWLSYQKVEKFDECCKKFLKQFPTDIVFGMDRNSCRQTHIRAGNGVHAAYLKKGRLSENPLKKLSFAMNPLHRTILSMEKSAFENPALQRLYVNSYMVRDEVLTYFRTPLEKIEVVHNGVEWNEMEEDFRLWPQQKEALAKELKLDPSKYQFLFMGHNYRRKGLQQLLLGLTHIQEDFHLSVVGKDSQIDAFKKMAEKLGLKNKVTFFGPRKDTKAFYQLADCLVIPSLYDPFANVTVEALAMGLFVVSSSLNGGCEVLDLDSGSIIDDLSDPESIADALKSAIKRFKTLKSSQAIRNSVAHLDFSLQLQQYYAPFASL